MRALATTSHCIAATSGYPDGEDIPLDLHLEMVARITAAVDVPVSMDLEAGCGDPRAEVQTLVEGLGRGRLSVISVPGASLPVRDLQDPWVARVSSGPFPQRVSPTALLDAAAALVDGATLPEGTRALD